MRIYLYIRMCVFRNAYVTALVSVILCTKIFRKTNWREKHYLLLKLNKSGYESLYYHFCIILSSKVICIYLAKLLIEKKEFT